jgi:hypothetical protein
MNQGEAIIAAREYIADVKQKLSNLIYLCEIAKLKMRMNITTYIMGKFLTAII